MLYVDFSSQVSFQIEDKDWAVHVCPMFILYVEINSYYTAKNQTIDMDIIYFLIFHTIISVSCVLVSIQ